MKGKSDPSTAAPPVGGEANRLCREVLAKALGVSVSQVEITKGHRGPRRRVRVRGAEAAPGKKFGIQGENR